MIYQMKLKPGLQAFNTISWGNRVGQGTEGVSNHKWREHGKSANNDKDYYL